MEQQEQPVQPVPPVVPVQTGGIEPDPQARQWAMFCHLAAFAGYVIPLGSLIGPLIIWLIKREEMPFVDAHGKAVVNFQISVVIYGAISAVLIFIVIGIFLLIALGIFTIVMTIIAALKANAGESYQYPLAITFIK